MISGCWSGDAALLMMIRDLDLDFGLGVRLLGGDPKGVLHDLLCLELEPDLLPDEELGDGDLLTDTVLLPVS